MAANSCSEQKNQPVLSRMSRGVRTDFRAFFSRCAQVASLSLPSIHEISGMGLIISHCFCWTGVLHEHPRIGSDGESEEVSLASDPDVTSPVKMRQKNRRLSEVSPSEVSKRFNRYDALFFSWTLAAGHQQAPVAAGGPANPGVVPGETVDQQPHLRRAAHADQQTPVALGNWIRPNGDVHQARQARRGIARRNRIV